MIVEGVARKTALPNSFPAQLFSKLNSPSEEKASARPQINAVALSSE